MPVDPADIVIPAELKPVDGRFGSGPSGASRTGRLTRGGGRHLSGHQPPAEDREVAGGRLRKA